MPWKPVSLEAGGDGGWATGVSESTLDASTSMESEGDKGALG